mmetsp:Transcript_36122/g.84023  ORF Transcript_36122/g.84023 Transcript_36122/m.84023 type:complete len:205 (-) Transcript_36122:160-774(-)
MAVRTMRNAITASAGRPLLHESSTVRSSVMGTTSCRHAAVEERRRSGPSLASISNPNTTALQAAGSAGSPATPSSPSSSHARAERSISLKASSSAAAALCSGNAGFTTECQKVCRMTSGTFVDSRQITNSLVQALKSPGNGTCAVVMAPAASNWAMKSNRRPCTASTNRPHSRLALLCSSLRRCSSPTSSQRVQSISLVSPSWI